VSGKWIECNVTIGMVNHQFSKESIVSSSIFSGPPCIHDLERELSES